MLLGAMSGGGVVVAVAVAYAALAVVALRMALSYKSALYAVRRLWRWADEWAQAYQYHEVPRFACDGGGAENPLFRKAAQYVAVLPSLEDADAASVLSSASRTNGGFSLQLGPGHTARDAFLGARLAWTNRGDVLVLRVRRHDRTRVLRPYLQHVESVADEMELRRRELRLFANTGVDGSTGTPRWASAPFTHPATLDTVAMDPDLKARVRADLENFLKGRAYYHRLGRVWRRSYLLYGPLGTGKSTFAAAMARFLGYDIYDVDLSRAGSDDLRALLLHTTPRSLILVEDLDRFLQGGGAGDAEARAARVLSFMDGVASCCGEERVMVFTMRGGKEGVDAAVVRPGGWTCTSTSRSATSRRSRRWPATTSASRTTSCTRRWRRASMAARASAPPSSARSCSPTARRRAARCATSSRSSSTCPGRRRRRGRRTGGTRAGPARAGHGRSRPRAPARTRRTAARRRSRRRRRAGCSRRTRR
ncbi:hypothetical protein DAI22_03g012900 [Oryza sativa Japonica Group]|nr:hypothetical protein DAI22_03g012900 [Oryza sativa Japonica Group]